MRVRAIEIDNFRSIKRCVWYPQAGINCLIGPGDSGKSTLVEAVDLCLGARRNWQFTDADFHELDIDKPIRITITIGDLEDSFKKLDGFGHLVRSFDEKTNTIEDEPERQAETVLTVVLSVRGNLEPTWVWYSERAEESETARNVSWADKQRLSPTWIGAHPAGNLAWRRGSVLTRLSDEKADVSDALAKAARQARSAFGEAGAEQLAATLDVVRATAKELGVPTGEVVKAMLDPLSVTFSGGTIALHSEQGVPLAALGAGSARLLIVGLQRKAAQSSILLIDELETGLEPHRIIRLITSLGAKEENPPLQVFMTTHSPAVIRELAAEQLFVVRREKEEHVCRQVPRGGDIQGVIRLFPEALLAQSVLVCEGASEVGFVRGIDLHRSGASRSEQSIAAKGVALVDGGGVNQMYGRANVFQSLGYRTATLRDDDKQPAASDESAFKKEGGHVFCWAAGRTTEDEMFLGVGEAAVVKLIEHAVELYDAATVDANIKSASNGQYDLAACKLRIDGSKRVVLGRAAGNKNAWFKRVTDMEEVACRIVGPDLDTAEKGFQQRVSAVFQWVTDGV